ncbi:MAG: tRNA threonylcarbamoyladenosine dehydratase [Ruminococcaceae bacterium]|nr:tRNA threonylcarbamoyladenosine dehydratase [Oscillospiraceae bacterium]
MEKAIPAEQTRTAALLSEEGLHRLSNAKVAVFGIGGVGGHLVEALARAGVGHLTLVDRDNVSLSNINRQAVALHSTVGRPKVDVMADRIRDIAPSCTVDTHELFYLPETAELFDLSAFDFVADCVDTVAAKIELAVRCDAAGTPLIAAMGAGNKLYPERFRISDISKTETDPLARIMRRELKKRGIKKLLCVWSDEPPRASNLLGENGKPAPASISFVPSAMGLIMAGEIIRTLAQA